MESNIERIPVVTGLVYSGDKIALIKRSDQVGTYRGLWAGFSGYIERLPLEQAHVELEEEAGLTRDQAQLNGIGVPVPLDDAETGARWLVLPFLFELGKGAEIETNWEASEWGWFSPQEIGKLQIVPGLQKVVSAVWPAFGDREFWDQLAEVANNTEEGATELARRGLKALGRFAETWWDELGRSGFLRSIRAFASCRPSMGVFPDLAARLLLATEREDGQLNLDALIAELLEELDDATTASASYAAEGLNGVCRLFTLSKSEAVCDAIMAWRHRDAVVIVAESAPGGEGRRLAEYLRERNIEVETVPDSEIAIAVKRADAVLVGCDAITEADEVQNKTGTRAAVDAAVEAGIPAYAVAQTFKIVPPGWPLVPERQWPAGAAGSSQTEKSPDPIFDVTPITSFRTVFTEEGALSSARLKEIRTELGSVGLVGG